MASYVLNGYTTPTGVNSSSAVKEVQQQLGVKADGIWGPVTQAAYEASQRTSSSSSNSGQSVTTSTYSSGVSTPSGRTSTTFTSTGGTLANTPNAKYSDTTGDFATARNRQSGYIEHASGYTGNGYRDEKGRYYTDYGALLREDGFFYPEGATVSQNGMYYDVGSGWQYANTARTGNGNYVYSATASSGVAPGTTVLKINKDDIGVSSYGGYSGTSGSTKNTIENKLAPPSAEWESYFDSEIEKYQKKLTEGYGMY